MNHYMQVVMNLKGGCLHTKLVLVHFEGYSDNNNNFIINGYLNLTVVNFINSSCGL